MMSRYVLRALLSLLVVAAACCAELPTYSRPTIFGRTGVTSFNLPDFSSVGSNAIKIDDLRNAALDVNVVGGTGNAGLFFGTLESNTVVGGIVFDSVDFISGGPSLNSQGKVVFGVGSGDDLFVYDADTNNTDSINSPLGLSSTSGLTIGANNIVGGRLRFPNGNIYATFPQQSSGIPTPTIYAADNDVDGSSPYSFLYSPDMSLGIDGPPRIAAKISTNAGFDFEEIRIFEADGTSQRIAYETEIESDSPFSEFVVNSVSISDDGNKVAFQALDTAGVSGVYVYDDITQSTSLIASESDILVGEIDAFAPQVNNHGIVTFRGDDQHGKSSVFVGDGSSILRLAGEGDMIETDLGLRQLGRRDNDFSQSGGPAINNLGDVGFIFQYFDPSNPSSVADGKLIMMATTILSLGDFDNNGLYDCDDIDMLVAAVAAASNQVSFDLTGDGLVNLDDVNAWLAQAGQVNLGEGKAYLAGDANLDGFVDASDFNVWNVNKFTTHPGWCAGDFNADGSIDTSDFNVWNMNKFASSDLALSVPEPQNLTMLVLGLAIAMTCRADLRLRSTNA